MNAGKLSDLIVFQVLTITQDSFGAAVEAWTESFREMAEYQGIGSTEFPALNKLQSKTTARFIIRYRSDIDPATHRIVARNKTWNITEPMPDRHNTQLTIEASEIE